MFLNITPSDDNVGCLCAVFFFKNARPLAGPSLDFWGPQCKNYLGTPPNHRHLLTQNKRETSVRRQGHRCRAWSASWEGWLWSPDCLLRQISTQSAPSIGFFPNGTLLFEWRQTLVTTSHHRCCPIHQNWTIYDRHLQLKTRRLFGYFMTKGT